MNILKYICLPGLLVSGDIQTVSAVESKTDKNPNILVILIDDAGYNDFGFMGSKEMQTPNIDALTSEGVVFTDAHVAATVSSPSRACLITGRYGHRFGYEDEALFQNKLMGADVIAANRANTLLLD
jgi:arylsulfatase A-like enzyme